MVVLSVLGSIQCDSTITFPASSHFLGNDCLHGTEERVPDDYQSQWPAETRSFYV